MRSPFAKLVAFCLLLLAVLQPPAHHATPPPAPSASFPNPEPIQVELLKRAEGIKWRQTLLWHETVEANRARQGEARAAMREPQQTEQSQHVAHFDPGSVQQLILDVFGAAGPAALSVAKCESGYSPAATNGQYRGIFQLGDYHRARAERLGYSWDQMLEPYPNIVVAHDLFLEQGWGPWECKP